AMRAMLFAIVATNGTWLEAGMTKIVLPPAFAFASNAGPGATNVGTALYLLRFPCAPDHDTVVAATAAQTPISAATAAAGTTPRFFIRCPPLRRWFEPTPGSRASR